MSAKRNQPVDPRDSFIPGFAEIPLSKPKKKHKQMEGAIWTRRKALLIQTYLQLFVYITRRGTYIDAFAGPQTGHVESNTWAARKIWESDPGPKRRRIDRVELFEKSRQSVKAIREMISKTPGNGRKLSVVSGDSNVTLLKRLAQAPVKGPAFCLLDQRSDECNWDTVKAVAAHKADPTKIELFYFVMAGWLDRYRSGLGSNGHEKFLKWWGHPDFSKAEKAAPQRAAELFAERFREELGYEFVYSYPIFDNIAPSDKGAVKFFMIHASDHPDASELMRRSYDKLATGWDPSVQQEGMDFLKESDLTAMLSGIKSWDQHITDEEEKKRRKRRPSKG